MDWTGSSRISQGSSFGTERWSAMNNVNAAAFDRSSVSSSPHGSGQNSPDRRPSVNLIPGTDKPILFLTPKDMTVDVFENDYDLLTLRNHVNQEFLDVFKEGVSYYLSGDWPTAKTFLERADSMMLEAAPSMGGDGPSRTLLSYLQSFNNEAPKWWKGFRPLTSK